MFQGPGAFLANLVHVGFLSVHLDNPHSLKKFICWKNELKIELRCENECEWLFNVPRCGIFWEKVNQVSVLF